MTWAAKVDHASLHWFHCLGTEWGPRVLHDHVGGQFGVNHRIGKTVKVEFRDW